MLAFDAMRSSDGSDLPASNGVAVQVPDAAEPPSFVTAAVSAAAPTRPAFPSLTGYAIDVAAESRLINA